MKANPEPHSPWRDRLTRREILRGAGVALGVMAIGDLSACSGCSGKPERTPSGPGPATATPAAAGTPIALAGDRATPQTAGASRKPNILFIFPDQWRGDTIGCVGHPAVLTPNVDRLAAESVTFTHCYTNSPLCMPARASLITGQYVHQHGVWNNDTEASPSSPSHVRNIRDAGYRTALIGKAHLYLHQKAIDTRLPRNVQKLRDWGYEDSIELLGPDGFAYFDSSYSDDLAQKGELDLYRQYMLDYLDKLSSGQARPWEEKACPVPAADHADSYVGRMAVEWIQNYQADRPFYLQVLFTGPHDPFDSAAEYRAMYQPGQMPLAIMDKINGPITPYVKAMLALSPLEDMTEDQCRLMRAFYYAKITLLDDWIGKIVDAVEAKGILDNTWILLSSDHGEMLGDHRLMHKVVFYEGATQVPCIVRPPGGTEAWQSTGFVDHLDLAATLLNIAAAKPLAGSAGKSLLPRVRAGPNTPEGQKGREVIFSEVVGYSMVRSERYKLAVEARTQEPAELYDLANDPKELRNLVDDPSMEKVRRDLVETYLRPFLSRAGGQKG